MTTKYQVTPVYDPINDDDINLLKRFLLIRKLLDGGLLLDGVYVTDRDEIDFEYHDLDLIIDVPGD